MLPGTRLARRLVACSSAAFLATTAAAQTTATLALRGRPQTHRLYGTRGDAPVVVSSGDGGWIHLAPHVAENPAAHAGTTRLWVVDASNHRFSDSLAGFDRCLLEAIGWIAGQQAKR